MRNKTKIGIVAGVIIAIVSIFTPSSAQSTSENISLSAPTYAPYNGNFNLTADLSINVSRPVDLERLSNGTWQVEETKTASNTVSFTDSITVLTNFRVVAPAYNGLSRLVSDTETVKAVVMYDDFDGTSLSDYWSLRDAGIYQHAHASMRAVEVSDGTLKLKVVKDPDNPGHYLTGHIGTQDSVSFTRGHLLARVKFHRYRGSHSAVWAQGGYGPGGAEIDGGEYFGGGPNLHFTIWNDPEQDGTLNKHTVAALDDNYIGTDKWWNSFHTVHTFWNTDGYTFYIDSDEVGHIAMTGATKPAYVVLSMLISDWEYPKLDPSTLSSQTLTVDWLRVWR